MYIIKKVFNKNMIWAIAGVLFILWLMGFSFHVGGNLVHTLIVIAVILIILRLLGIV